MKSFWYKKKNNFGDLIAPILIEALSGEKAVYCEYGGGRMITVGSLLHFLQPNDVVWGTGSLRGTNTCEPSVKVHAVRGPKTREQFLQNTIAAPAVYGDPALLLPFVFCIDNTPEHSVCLVPHYYDAQLLRGVRLDSCPIVDVCSGISNVIAQIAKAEVVLSSALHGIILAESLGKPAIRVVFQDWRHSLGRPDGTWKFDDYYLGTGRRSPPPVDWSGCRVDDIAVDAAIRSAKRNAPLDDEMLATISQALLESCPFNRTMSSLRAPRLPLPTDSNAMDAATGRWRDGDSASGTDLREPQQSLSTGNVLSYGEFSMRPNEYMALDLHEKLAYWERNPLVGNITIQLPSTPPFLMKCNNDDTVVKDLHWSNYRGWESASLMLWAAICTDAELVLDIGAYTGIYTLVAKSVSPNCRAIAFEPDADNADRLQQNLKLNDLTGVQVSRCAVSDRAGIASFFEHRVSPRLLSSVGSIAKEKNATAINQVPTVCVDDFLAEDECGTPTHVKLDVEGAETEAIYGMRGIIQTASPDLLVEITAPSHLVRIKDALTASYHAYGIDEESHSVWQIPLSSRAIEAQLKKRKLGRNVLFTTRDLRDTPVDGILVQEPCSNERM